MITKIWWKIWRIGKGVDMKSRLLALLTIFFIISVFYGCSVGLALSGKKTPEIGEIKIGSSREEVEMHLGSPISSRTFDDQTRIDIYVYEIGTEPSGKRALGYAALDVVTIGLWELVGTPLEIMKRGKKFIKIKYDKNDNVVSLRTFDR